MVAGNGRGGKWGRAFRRGLTRINADQARATPKAVTGLHGCKLATEGTESTGESHSPKMGSEGETGDFQIDIFLAPDGKAGSPVFSMNGFAGAGPVLGREDTGRGGKLGSGHFAAKGAGGDANLRVVADALELAGVAASHDVEISGVFAEPDGGGDGGASFAEGGEQEVFVPLDLGRDGHEGIVKQTLNHGGHRGHRGKRCATDLHGSARLHMAGMVPW
ncbi:hypothetical protein SBA7_290010 [Candidatus Sulfotelmatobacter sp. SbA7]|jgi:hypothetical protein|nr:hypothetical protein SBA7_290010 [Candidatus Sulfotelmatobacter sp. SbA7]